MLTRHFSALCTFFQEGYGEDGTSICWAVYGYASLVFIDDDIVTDAEAETCTFALLFGGKEGFENAVSDFFWHAWPVVAYGAVNALGSFPCCDGDGARSVSVV